MKPKIIEGNDDEASSNQEQTNDLQNKENNEDDDDESSIVAMLQNYLGQKLNIEESSTEEKPVRNIVLFIGSIYFSFILIMNIYLN